MIDIKLFGPTVVLLDGEPVAASDLGGVKPRQILEMLAVELGSPVSKDRLADQLWDEQPPASYVATLESYVCVLRRRLRLAKGSTLVTTNSGYLLDPEVVTADLPQVRALLSHAPDVPAEDIVSRSERALALLGGHLLASEPYLAWANCEREKLSRQLAETCTHAARLANETGDSERAVLLARTAVDQGLFTEGGTQELMRGLSAQGRRGEALQAYADLRARMTDELGIEPGPVSQRLYLEILRGTPAQTPTSDRHEVRALLRLLRQAVESGATVDAASRAGFTEMALLLDRRSA